MFGKLFDYVKSIFSTPEEAATPIEVEFLVGSRAKNRGGGVVQVTHIGESTVTVQRIRNGNPIGMFLTMSKDAFSAQYDKEE